MNYSYHPTVKKNLNKIKTYYSNRKYYTSELSNILFQTSTILKSMTHPNKSTQFGGVKVDELLKNIEETNKKISVLGTEDFKKLVETMEQVVDVFEPVDVSSS